MIVEVTSSEKRFCCVTLDTGKSFDFGYKYGETFIDHLDKRLRKRHLGNRTKQSLISNLVPSSYLYPVFCPATVVGAFYKSE